MDNITGNIALNKLVNIDLNGKTLTGNVTINTTATGSIALSGAGIITGDLNITALNATVTNNNTIGGITNVTAVSYNSFISTGTHTGGINMLGQGRLKLTGAASAATVTVQTTQEVRLAGTVAKVIVNTANANVTVNNDGTVAEVEATQPVNLVNNGNITTVSGTAEVTLSGEGKVDNVTNTDVKVPNIESPDQKLDKEGELNEIEGIYSTSFIWSSQNGVGSGNLSKHTSPGGYKYFSNGAYLDITVKKDGDNLKFNDVLSNLTLQTNNGNVDNISGTDTGRQAADWGKANANHTGTKLKVENSNSVFYGVRQNNTNGVATVGFNAGESRTIHLTATPKDGLAAGTYTITVQPKQQETETSGKDLGSAITYSFTVAAPDTTAQEKEALTTFLTTAKGHSYSDTPELGNYKALSELTVSGTTVTMNISEDTDKIAAIQAKPGVAEDTAEGLYVMNTFARWWVSKR